MIRLYLIVVTFIFSTLMGTASVAAPDLELDGIPNNSDNCIFLVFINFSILLILLLQF